MGRGSYVAGSKGLPHQRSNRMDYCVKVFHVTATGHRPACSTRDSLPLLFITCGGGLVLCGAWLAAHFAQRVRYPHVFCRIHYISDCMKHPCRAASRSYARSVRTPRRIRKDKRRNCLFHVVSRRVSEEAKFVKSSRTELRRVVQSRKHHARRVL
ncbi:unnamed protein product [Trypanosoma congolense IL3000]|uniref:WGS project CAEQ00000000 data, annotated contig 1387 n=1 Tax=Trypanosoma congolense (strain IL3000) TaxID=1068625 RepID=F9W5V7_TRYCI|nr:unnamed protein product [Trypanosoma congolense IL3000]